jgi:antitoxin component YwqK of YwqJK toxin-antitoxin module
VIRFLFILLALIPSFSALAQTGGSYQVFKGDTINRTDSRGLKQGLWRKYYRTDTLCSETLFKNNKPYGVSRTWNENGKLKAEVVFETKDPRRASGVSFYENGKVMARGRYFDQKKDSVWVFYGENDSIKAIERYVKGLAEGEWSVFYEDGRLAEIKTYVKGKREGHYRQFNLNGNLIFEMQYKADVEDGPVRIFYGDGSKREEGMYRKGLKEGTWTYFDSSGKVLNRVVFVNGVEKTD